MHRKSWKFWHEIYRRRSVLIPPALFARLLIPVRHWIGIDPLLLVAMIRENWDGGKFGFQFLPDPADELRDYAGELWTLQEVFEEGLEGDPLKILTGDDREFYLSLPERFTVYRGCAGISAERAGEGLCWTTKRDVADWFAKRSAEFNSEPVVVTGRAAKRDVYFVKAIEHEVVVAPRRCRSIKPRRRKVRPDMEWKPGCSKLRIISIKATVSSFPAGARPIGDVLQS